MKRVINSAKYVKYNANNAGNSVGDCVKRAISLAFDMSYREMSKLLNSAAKESGLEFNQPLVYRTVVRQLQGDKAEKWTWVPREYEGTLEDFIDENCQSGTWLIETGSSQKSMSSNHIVCVIDGALYDSWDSLEEYPKAYTQIHIDSRREFTDIQDHMPELVPKFKDLLEAEASKLVKKYADKGAEWAQAVTLIRAEAEQSAYQIRGAVVIHVDPRSYYPKASSIRLKAIAVLTPNTTIDEAHAKIKETAKVRLYDRFYELNKLQNDKKETYEAEQEQGGQVEKHIFGQRANSVYKTLPPWARAACNYLSVDRPGRYSDSYSLYLTEAGTGNDLHFYAPTADILREELKMFDLYGTLPGRDYDLSAEFDW